MSGHNFYYGHINDRGYRVSIPYMSGHNRASIISTEDAVSVSIPYMSGHNLPFSKRSSLSSLSQSPICRVIMNSRRANGKEKIRSQSPICRVIICR